MPQLDLTLIFNQAFWLIIIFLTFYILVTYLFLPNIYNIFYLRNLIFKGASQNQKSDASTIKFTLNPLLLKMYLTTCTEVFLNVFVKKTFLINNHFITNIKSLTQLQVNVLKSTSNIMLFGVSIFSGKPLRLY